MDLFGTNVNQVYSSALHWLNVAGDQEDSRNGPVIVSPEPVLSTYRHPTQRVLFSPMRDANPFFHLMEALWMLDGRNDVAFPAQFNRRFMDYSDDGKIVHGAYGHRWRTAFGGDQLPILVKELKNNPTSRRCVLQMWDEHLGDLHQAMYGGKDVPCNTHVYFDCRNQQLNMTVCCRSNDLIWGMCGANAVHFSMLQEFMAAWIDIEVGVYRQFSNNLHVYTNVLPADDLYAAAEDAKRSDLYIEEEGIRPATLVLLDIVEWQRELKVFLDNPATDNQNWREPFFPLVAQPMYLAWQERKTKRGDGRQYARKIAASDWRRACLDWIQRREERKSAA